MSVVYDDGRVVLHQGHVLNVLRAMREASVHAVVTSPPFWGLRDYGIEPQVWGGEDHEHEWGEEGRSGQRNRSGEAGGIHEGRSINKLAENTMLHPSTGAFCSCGAWRGHLGLEPRHDCLAWARGSPLCSACYVCHLVLIFREVRRVMRDDATCWLNLGDSYASDTKWGGATSGKHVSELHGHTSVGRHKRSTGLKDKDLVMVPARVALALQADGWWLRSDIIWAKPNPMPESVADRPTKAHEYLFLLSKSARYFYDAEAIKEPDAGTDHARMVLDGQPSLEPSGGLKSAHRGIRTPEGRNGSGRNRRSVWTIATEPYLEAHFAAFPQDLVKPCIMAGTSERSCAQCGAPWARVVEKATPVLKSPSGWNTGASGRRYTELTGRFNNREYDGKRRQEAANAAGRRMSKSALAVRDAGGDHNPFSGARTIGWRPTCKHYDNRYRKEFRRARRMRRREQQEASGLWWPRVRRRPGLASWPVDPCITLDPFTGSGTAVHVAHELGRRAIGIDLNADYLAQAMKRLRQSVLF